MSRPTNRKGFSASDQHIVIPRSWHFFDRKPSYFHFVFDANFFNVIPILVAIPLNTYRTGVRCEHSETTDWIFVDHVRCFSIMDVVVPRRAGDFEKGLIVYWPGCVMYVNGVGLPPFSVPRVMRVWVG